jgi:hypothetical protein
MYPYRICNNFGRFDGRAFTPKSRGWVIMRNFIMAALLIFSSIDSVALAAKENTIFEIETDGSYRMETDASPDLAKRVALFNAKRKAVDLAGRYLSRKYLIKPYELNRDEIYSLAAREILAEILEEKRETIGKISTYRLRIRCRIRPSDFVKAEIEDSKQEKKEAKESYQEEMEQNISAEIDPGRDIAKAYRLLREKKWRITMIYLNHLEKKYPNWDRIHMAKAITHYILHEPVFMEKALNKACRLGNVTACDDLKNLKKVHKHDFGLHIID